MSHRTRILVHPALLVLALLSLGGCSLTNDFGEYRLACAGDTDCPSPATESCQSGRCVPRSACGTESPCAPTFECQDGYCVYVAPERAPSGIDLTAGSGETTSAHYLVRLNVGLPQPMGRMESEHYRIQLGPQTP